MSNSKRTAVSILVALGLFAGHARHAAGEPTSRPSKPAAALPKVLLIGDSISMQYTPFVRQRLAGKATVKRIPTNGGSTARGLAHIEKWLGDEAWDVIHFNWGAHDLMVMQNGKPQVDIQHYEENLRKLVNRLQRTGAKLVWASIMPVPDGKLMITPILGVRLSNSDVEAYNAVATKVMTEHGIPIDDLYGFGRPRLGELQIPADVHLTIHGAVAVAEPVANSILTALGQVPSSQPHTRPITSRATTSR